MTGTFGGLRAVYVWSNILSSSFCLFVVPKVSLESLNGFASNSLGRRVWSLARKSLNVKIKGQGDQGQNRDNC